MYIKIDKRERDEAEIGKQTIVPLFRALGLKTTPYHYTENRSISLIIDKKWDSIARSSDYYEEKC